MWAWLVEEEIISPRRYHALIAVKGLKPGRTAAKELGPVKPVADSIVEATSPHLTWVIAAMVKVQRLTGARPGEICRMRTIDIDRSGPVWFYKPIHHKNAYRGHHRTIAIGPRGQELLQPFLRQLNAEAFIFSPADSMAEMRERRRLARTTPLRTDQIRPSKSEPKREPGQRFNPTALHRSIVRACDIAFPPPDHLAQQPKESVGKWMLRLTDEQQAELKAWRRAHRWHPHQLRHTAATELRRLHGLEAVQVVLGHAVLTQLKSMPRPITRRRVKSH